MALSKGARFTIYSDKFFADDSWMMDRQKHRDGLIGSVVRFRGRSHPSKGELVKIVEHDFRRGVIVVKTKGFSYSSEGDKRYIPAQYHVAEFKWDNILFTQEQKSNGQYREATVSEHIISHNAKGANHSFYK